jgi:hypothetical protein
LRTRDTTSTRSLGGALRKSIAARARFLDASKQEQPPNAENAYERAVDAIGAERRFGRFEQTPGERWTPFHYEREDLNLRRAILSSR